MKLSNSALNLYGDCPRSYKLNYIDKLRAIEQPSSLTFGGAVDKAFTAMLTGSDNPEALFISEWKLTTDNPNTTYTKADLDMELIPSEFYSLHSDDVRQLSGMSLQVKGLLMIKALREKILPKITKVHSTQEAIALGNTDESGDSFIGFVDFIADYEGYDKPIIFDLKTSSVKYAPESVQESQQLTIYTYAAGDKYNTKLAGYIVLSKKIRKIRTKVCSDCKHTVVNNTSKTCNNIIANSERCGGAWDITVEFDVDVDVIIDTIPSKTEEIVLDLMDNTHAKIKAGEFPQNPDSCFNKKYHRRCVYYDLCHSNSMEGLVKK